jgi:hypothetical protein
MKTRLLGDITIDRILEQEAPLARPLDWFDKALPEAIEPHRHWLEPKALDPETGMMILPVQSYLLRTRHHSILIDSCIGCRKIYDGMPEWKDLRDESWLDRLADAGVGPGDIDYVFCTHLHSDHCGWNTRLVDGRWTPTFPNAKYILAAKEYAASEAAGTAVFLESVLPIMEAGQAVLVETDYALEYAAGGIEDLCPLFFDDRGQVPSRRPLAVDPVMADQAFEFGESGNHQTQDAPVGFDTDFLGEVRRVDDETRVSSRRAVADPVLIEQNDACLGREFRQPAGGGETGDTCANHDPVGGLVPGQTFGRRRLR